MAVDVAYYLAKINQLRPAGKPWTEANVTLVQIPSGETDPELAGKNRDAFTIEADQNGITVRSYTEDGLRNGLNYHLSENGIIRYFPHPDWEVAPQFVPSQVPRFSDVIRAARSRVKLKLTDTGTGTQLVTMSKTVAPSYDSRRIWYAYGAGTPTAQTHYEEWFVRNLQTALSAQHGHSYDSIVTRNKAQFLAHPEWFSNNTPLQPPAEEGGQPVIPGDVKFEVHHEDLVQLIIQDRLNAVAEFISATGVPPISISIDPSDGGGFSTSPESLAIGPPNNQVYYLANRVAQAFATHYPGVKVGLLAYNFHAAPPDFPLEPNILVAIATAFNQSAYTMPQLEAMWSAAGITLGTYDYLGVMQWDWDVMGQPRGAHLDYVQQIVTRYGLGYRTYSSETNQGWISKGLGQYIAARLLWNVTADVEQIKTQFFTSCFKKAAAIMTGLYAAWEEYPKAIPGGGDLRSWMLTVKDAMALEADPKVQARLYQHLRYLHHTFLFRKWQLSGSLYDKKDMLNFGYRIMDEGSTAAFQMQHRTTKSAATAQTEIGIFYMHSPDAIWKTPNTPITDADTLALIDADIVALEGEPELNIFQLPAPEDVPGYVALMQGVALSHQVYFLLYKQPGTKLTVQVSAGQVSVPLEVYPYNQNAEPDANVLFHGEVNGGETKEFTFDNLPDGPYIMSTFGLCGLALTGGGGLAIVASPSKKVKFFGLQGYVKFRVDALDAFTLSIDGKMTVVSPTGRTLTFAAGGSYAIQPEAGETGLWQIKNFNWTLTMEGVVPLVIKP